LIFGLFSPLCAFATDPHLAISMIILTQQGLFIILSFIPSLFLQAYLIKKQFPKIPECRILKASFFDSFVSKTLPIPLFHSFGTLLYARYRLSFDRSIVKFLDSLKTRFILHIFCLESALQSKFCSFEIFLMINCIIFIYIWPKLQ